MPLTMQPVALSEAGRRENNEDAAFVSPRLLAVADGVGGAAAGDVASHLAMLKMVGLDNRRLVHPLERELADAVADANALISFATFYDPRHTGMATTLTAVALSNNGQYVVANVGDSRTYLLRNGLLRQLTRDDSVVQELIERGVIDESEARRHPQRSLVLQALDGAVREPPAVRKVHARIGDRLLLCSDGVTDYLADERLAVLLGNPDAAVAVRQIVEAALHDGSRDNITAVIADVIVRVEPDEGWLDAFHVPTR